MNSQNIAQQKLPHNSRNLKTNLFVCFWKSKLLIHSLPARAQWSAKVVRRPVTKSRSSHRRAVREWPGWNPFWETGKPHFDIGRRCLFCWTFYWCYTFGCSPDFCKGNDPKMIDHVHMTRASEGSPCICEAGTEIPGSSSFCPISWPFAGSKKGWKGIELMH